MTMVVYIHAEFAAQVNPDTAARIAGRIARELEIYIHVGVYDDFLAIRIDDHIENIILYMELLKEEPIFTSVINLNDKGENNIMNMVKLNSALKSLFKGNKKAFEIFNATTGVSTATSEDGGALISTQLLDLKEINQGGSLSELTSVYIVNRDSGTLPILDYSKQSVLTDVDELGAGEEIKPVFDAIAYNLAKKGAIAGVSRELVNDTEGNILEYIAKAYNVAFTKDKNAAIIKSITADATNYTDAVSAIDAIKSAAIKCPVGAGNNVSIVAGQSTLEKLALAKDTAGNYLLIETPDGYTMAGKKVYPVDDEILDGVIVGDFSVIAVVERLLEIVASGKAAGGFEKNSYLMRMLTGYQAINTYQDAFKKITIGEEPEDDTNGLDGLSMLSLDAEGMDETAETEDAAAAEELTGAEDVASAEDAASEPEETEEVKD